MSAPYSRGDRVLHVTRERVWTGPAYDSYTTHVVGTVTDRGCRLVGHGNRVVSFSALRMDTPEGRAELDLAIVHRRAWVRLSDAMASFQGHNNPKIATEEMVAMTATLTTALEPR